MNDVLFHYQQHKIHQAPSKEIPAGPVPNTGQQPNDQQISNVFSLPGYARSAQREIDIVPEPGPKGNMPAPPELSDTPGNVGIIKVFIKMKTKYPAQTNGHIRIAREIKENLKRVGKGSQPSHAYGKLAVRCTKCLIRYDRQLVGQQHFLEKSPQEPFHACAKILPGGASFLDFSGNGFKSDNGTCNKLRKERDIQTHIQRIFLTFSLSPVHIHDIGDRLKGKKGNTDGQYDFCLFKNRENAVDVSDGKVQILKNKQQCQICRHGGHENAFSPAVVLF